MATLMVNQKTIRNFKKELRSGLKKMFRMFPDGPLFKQASILTHIFQSE
jgi:hypothetical protein